ncbi:MAG: lipoate--protein ligase family protein [Leptolyngbya sp. UWPOB_LEPTO1]|uniref:lipoate--protein ligase family protein n=1 Tax=Leptolyngbya sp. UWPOB_LEPTO1 TaxID=2815653 RepID=UPI001AD30636|nr:biotin/lipoate A/B protein ligase family protein [Leptolyngbya sp. UWPOB_LEPTO1]MBN8562668.1 lipoate--protein ligase family protein [Leptolyngbya sp. UWPOB_LEPTO1]
MDKWRLIPCIEASGQVQMAIDTWLLEQHRTHHHPPTLRFYTWSPAAISLGYHQRQFPEFWKSLTWQGQAIELVRRPSGGRAVLHQGDLTYAVITSGLGSNRMQAYQAICEFLIQGWKQLGIELQYGEAGRGYIHNPNCFGTATGADLVTKNGMKLIGSAQLRRDNTILQHGSMRIKPDAKLFAQVFEQEIDVIDVEMTIETLINTLSKAAREHFNIDFVVQPLTDSEWSEILTT